MSWLKRLFAPEPPAPPPASAPQAPLTEEEELAREFDEDDSRIPLSGNRQTPRVKLLPLHEISFQPAGSEPLHLANLSLSGLGILRSPGTAANPMRGTRIRGALQLQSRRFDDVDLLVVHVTDRIIGCHFNSPAPRMLEALQRYFEVEFSSLTLIEINPEMLKAQDDGKPHSFHGRSHCELNFVENQGRVVRFDLSFFGHYVEGGESLATFFGELEHDHPEGKMAYKGSTLVRKKASASHDLVDLAVRFVSNIPALKPEFRDTIIGMIHRAKVE